MKVTCGEVSLLKLLISRSFNLHCMSSSVLSMYKRFIFIFFSGSHINNKIDKIKEYSNYAPFTFTYFDFCLLYLHFYIFCPLSTTLTLHFIFYFSISISISICFYLFLLSSPLFCFSFFFFLNFSPLYLFCPCFFMKDEHKWCTHLHFKVQQQRLKRLKLKRVNIAYFLKQKVIL